MFDHLLRLLDSRGSRMPPHLALRSLHADYIGGTNSNFKKWYFAAQLDIDDTIGFKNTKSDGDLKRNARSKLDQTSLEFFSIEESKKKWAINMKNLSSHDCIVQLALYLLCWGESNNIRFMPECLCFIFKCCNDYYYSLDLSQPIARPSIPFLDHVITPLYNFYRDQVYELTNGKYLHKDKDHSKIIGYDDINQLFWYRKGLQKLVLKNKSHLLDYKSHERYLLLKDINWSKVFYKTYKESRSWFHVLTNFNRIWIIHTSIYWFYTSLNSPTLYTKNYQQQLNNQPLSQVRFTVMALGGSIACLINIIATICEYRFVPRKWPGAQPLTSRMLFLLFLFAINTSPSIYILGFIPINQPNKAALGISISQFLISIFTVIYLSIVPLGSLLGSYMNKSDRKYLPTKTFTSSVHKLQGKAALSSYGLWIAVFLAKLLESYFFMTLSLRDPIRELSNMRMSKCVGDAILGKTLCTYQPFMVIGLMFLTDLVLFFLDTYLWFIIWNTLFSVCRSFYIGVSIWTPWRNIFSRLPKRIFSKIISTDDRNIRPKVLVSQVWNSIVISMYREHLLSLEHVQRLIYQQIVTPGAENGNVLKEPSFFVAQEDKSVKSSLFDTQNEAQRRITFFAQSLSTPMRESCSTDSMPTFTVLIPHYSEKITLTLREIIREEDKYSHVTLLEYLKQLHPLEWSCFVQDTKMLAEEIESGLSEEFNSDKQAYDDLPYYCVGFKSATPEYILRTRIWASLRSQTLYRTISGFMNYSRAIKLLYDVENPNLEDFNNDEQLKLERAAVMALRKFRIIVSMQRMCEFNKDEQENKEFLLRAYPELQIAYLEEEKLDTGEVVYYSSLIDGSCEISGDGQREPKYKIRLSGNPILGDGKSDNQNHALIFCRGEYIQLVDANQDNYLEECLKIRNVLAEFEEYEQRTDLYPEIDKITSNYDPVAIIGTREYIFSENIGILGDVAAGKEQTFGTLFARTLAQIGGKLHYGHPDFLNGAFMTTRGGVSKAQKGLHLNEDIYAGINAMIRGGRIKHCEYMQCGKGRDLGFGSILNFTTKIGAGMGEQMLSREYFYLGTQLPLDRFLSFYYAHPGFHLNNVFIILSVKLFLIVSVNLAALTHESVICEYDRNRPITDPHKPSGCYNLIPAIEWLQRCIISIFIVFSISFVPLMVQELTERGVWKAFTRLGKHFASLSPCFEVFVCKIYAQSLVNDLAVGGARYIATGRGFATVRIPFSVLYSTFAPQSLYFGASNLPILLFCSISMWKTALLWFWITIIALCICPFLYNPNQYSYNDFFLDYKNYLRWLSRGNTTWYHDSWISYVRTIRTQITGSKRKKLGKPGDNLASDFKKPSVTNLFFSQICTQLFATLSILVAYFFSNSQNDSRIGAPSNILLRVAIFSLGPIFVNMAVLIILFVFSCIFGPILGCCCLKVPAAIATLAHILSVINYVVFFEALWFIQQWDFSKTILGASSCMMVQCLLFKIVIAVFLTREMNHDRSNRAWWSGKWVTAGLGWNVVTQPIREFLCKVIEMSMFSGDFILGHLLLFIQIPILLIPYIDRWHSLMLFWLKPSRQIRPQVLSRKQKRKMSVVIYWYTIIFLLLLSLFVLIFLVPTFFKLFDLDDIKNELPENIQQLFQPNFSGSNSRKGLKGYRLMMKQLRG
ncbi:1,3-beta-glucan synthase [Ascoidea rubescens DSM 1968]|uniref:1,3-beta-glucan synthase n=1 Tax=Ascoidea rubescens DSM 1968 TaxID=1344418 RepID=A0A1D2VAN4_9ASCO|nr:glycosyltransferase family 48 protein [Ascoidea rubescens DSM 1968]ODV58493.1 glycosyltransferase family 48 protein [Ascoidea rubescens DSM 1968]